MAWSRSPFHKRILKMITKLYKWLNQVSCRSHCIEFMNVFYSLYRHPTLGTHTLTLKSAKHLLTLKLSYEVLWCLYQTCLSDWILVIFTEPWYSLEMCTASLARCLWQCSCWCWHWACRTSRSRWCCLPCRTWRGDCQRSPLSGGGRAKTPGHWWDWPRHQVLDDSRG